MDYLVRRADWDGGPDPVSPELLDGLERHLVATSLRLEHRGWLAGGRSGSPVARVVHFGRSRQLILKFFKTASQAGRMTLALTVDNDFVERHLTKLDGAPFGLGHGDAWAAFMQVAGGDLRSLQPIRKLREADPKRSDIKYGMIVRSLIVDWNAGNPRHQESTVRNVVGGIVRERRSRVVRWIRTNTEPGNREPLAFLVENALPRFADNEPCQWVIHDLQIGRAHGDFNARNILIPTDRGVRTDRFELIDYDHYSDNAPLARDPMHFLIALALDDFSRFEKNPNARADLIKVIVDPHGTDVCDDVEYFRRISREVHDACVNAFPKKDGLRAEWKQQCLLVLVGDALFRVGSRPSKDRPEPFRRWSYDLAVAAARSYLAEYAESFPPHTLPDTKPGRIINQFFGREALAGRLAYGPFGVMSVQGTAGAGKTALVDAVVETLGTDDGEQQRPRMVRRQITADHRLDVVTLLQLITDDAVRLKHRHGAALVELEKVLTGPPRPIVILIEAAENLLHEDSDRLVDLGLDEAFTMLNALDGHQISVVLETSDGERLKSAVTWPDEDTVKVRKLSAKEFEGLLRRMDPADERLGMNGFSPEDRRDLAHHAGGAPRIAELIYAAVRDARVSLATVLTGLRTQGPAATYLIDTILRKGRPSDGEVIKALAVFGTPVHADAVRAALLDVDPSEVEPALANLHLCHAVRHDDDLYFLPAADAKIVVKHMSGDELRERSFRSINALQRFLHSAPRTVSDLRYHFAQLRVALHADEFPYAFKLLSIIDDYLYPWRCTALLLDQRLKARGRFGNPALERVNENALGGIYMSMGDLDRADDAFGTALRLVEAHTETRDVARQRANLGSLQVATNRFDMALVNLHDGLARATEAGDSIARIGAITGLADLHRRQGRFDEAIKRATEAFGISGTPEFAEHAEAAIDGQSHAVALAARLCQWHAELENLEEAERWLDKVRLAGSGEPSHRATYVDLQADLLLFARLRKRSFAQVTRVAGQAVDLALGLQDRTTLRQARTTLCLAHLGAKRPVEAERAITCAGWHRQGGQHLVVLALAALVARVNVRASADDVFRDLLREADERIAAETADRVRTDGEPLLPEHGDFAARHFQGFARCGLMFAGEGDLDAAVESFRMPGIVRPQHAPGLNYRMEFMLRRLDDTGQRRGTLKPVIEALNNR